MTHPLIQELDTIDAMVDSHAWERALNALVAFDSRLVVAVLGQPLPVGSLLRNDSIFEDKD